MQTSLRASPWKCLTKELFNDWGDHGETSRNATISVEKGKKYSVRIEYYDNEYNGILRLQTLFIKN